MKITVASHRTLIEHYNGVRWRIVKSPNVGTGNALASVVATSSRNAWAVGVSGWHDNSSDPTATLAERWNGTSWTVQASPNSGSGGNQLTGVDASSSTEAWAVGFDGDNHPLALHCC